MRFFVATSWSIPAGSPFETILVLGSVLEINFPVLSKRRITSWTRLLFCPSALSIPAVQIVPSPANVTAVAIYGEVRTTVGGLFPADKIARKSADRMSLLYATPETAQE